MNFDHDIQITMSPSRNRSCTNVNISPPPAYDAVATSLSSLTNNLEHLSISSSYSRSTTRARSSIPTAPPTPPASAPAHSSSIQAIFSRLVPTPTTQGSNSAVDPRTCPAVDPRTCPVVDPRTWTIGQEVYSSRHFNEKRWYTIIKGRSVGVKYDYW